jgi:hypothetical protein
VKLTYPMFVQVVCDATCDVLDRDGKITSVSTDLSAWGLEQVQRIQVRSRSSTALNCI